MAYKVVRTGNTYTVRDTKKGYLTCLDGKIWTSTKRNVAERVASQANDLDQLVQDTNEETNLSRVPNKRF